MARAADTPFPRAVAEEVRLVDLAALLVVPGGLVAAFLLPVGAREQLVFERSEPTLATAYTSHFVHLDGRHLLGNVAVYLFVAPLSYLLCVLSGRRQLFWTSMVVFLTVFPFGLSTMQLVFPRDRLILGFSGINGGLFGLLCFSLVSYTCARLAAGLDERFAPALLFVTVGLIALVVLPADAWRVEIALTGFVFALVYVGAAVRACGVPSVATIRRAARPGYVELAGGGLGALLTYPLVGFGNVVLSGAGVVDVYVHLLGYALAFIVVFSFVAVVESS